jgi:exonuclease SbcD
MRILHTADWHVGKAVRGRSRAHEHEAALAELVTLADDREVGLVLVAGDLFDTAAPTAEAERIVYRGLLDLAAGGRPVVVVAGNHDSARRLAAVAPVFASHGVHVATAFAQPDEGGVLALDVAGDAVRVALLPFLSQRYVVGVDDLLTGGSADHALQYADRVRRIVGALTEGFDDDAVNVVLAHAMVHGGVLGGGERSAHTIFEYSVPATAFPPSAHYVALGHLHRTQQLPGPCPIWYPGSPLALDFGEEADRKHALVVEADPGRPAKVEQVPLTSGRPFRTVRGTLAEVEAAAGELGDAYVRVVLREPVVVGLADRVREVLPDVVEVRVEPPDGDRHDGGSAPHGLEQRSPHDLFAGYLDAQGIEDPRLLALFDEVLDDVLGEVPGADHAA